MSSTNATDWQTRLGLDYTPSSYQAAIFDFVADGDGNGMAVAVAGAGKSTSLAAAVRIATWRSRYVLALAFNVEAKDALVEKLEGTGARVKTVHSHGYACLCYTFRGCDVVASKYRDLVDSYIAEFEAAQTLAGDDCSPEEIKAILDDGYPRAAILKLLDFARLDLLDASADDFGRELRRLADHHDVDVDPVLGQLVTDVVRLAMRWGADNPRIVDYTDMVWLPTVLRLRPWTADWTFVDEAQDISKAHRALIRASMKRRGRALFVGDPKQAIYGFAGADADSFQAIVDEFECTILPLSVCYRCPTSVLDLAREIVPQIEARPGAPAGVVRRSTTDAFIGEARRGDMVLCRLNAPLLSLAFKLIGNGVSAAVRGRSDLGKGLAKIIDRCARAGWDGFGLAIDAWEDREREAARKRYGKRSEDALAAKLESISDQAECIRVIWGSCGAKSADDLKSAISRLFADKDPKVVLSSIHRAKGLESPRVFVALPERLGDAWPNSQPWVVEQEKNLEYVAYTRAQEELVFLDGCPERWMLDKPASDERGSTCTGYATLELDLEHATTTETGHQEAVICPGCAKQRSAGLFYDDACKSGDWSKFDSAVQDYGPCCNPRCGGEWGTGCYHCHHPRFWPRGADSNATLVVDGVPDTYDPMSKAARQTLARALDAKLRELGFAPSLPEVSVSWGSEIAYTRTRGDLVCKVYSTIVNGEVRGVGKDAIRVALTRDGRGVGKTKRVNRVGKIDAIVGRVVSRIESLTGEK